MGIDVFLTGMMLICFPDQEGCPVLGGNNTAWVVEAKPQTKVCGWDSEYMDTTLELRFRRDQLELKEDPYRLCRDIDDETECNLAAQRNIFIEPYPRPSPSDQELTSSLRSLPRMSNIDLRFKEFSRTLLDSYAPQRIQFRPGVIGAGRRWPPDLIRKRQWFRSNHDSGLLPKELADSVKVSYEKASYLTIENDAGTLLKLAPKPGGREYQVTIRNRGENLKPHEDGRYDDLAYLLWFYRLGTWTTMNGSCPPFKDMDDNRDVVLPRCSRVSGNSSVRCSQYAIEGSTRYWPAMLR